MLSAIGIPVYLHYCGGELEKVNYVLKSKGCCGEEADEDAEAATSDCCKDEHLVLKNSTDFTIKELHNYDLVKSYCHLFYIQLPFPEVSVQPVTIANTMPAGPAPPGLQHRLIISTSVLRI